MKNQNVITYIIVIIVIILALFVFYKVTNAPSVDIPDDHTVTIDSPSSYVWLSLDEAIDFAKQHGEIFRIVSIDGESQPVTMDYRVGRINASLIDWIVSEYYIEGNNQNMQEYTYPDRLLPAGTETFSSKIIFAVTKDKKVLLSKEYIEWGDSFIYSFPSAVIDDYENEKDTLIILEEETWYSTEDKIIYIWKTSSNWFSDGLNDIYFTKNSYKQSENKNNIEWVSLEELDNMATNKILLDPYSISNYFFVKSKTYDFTDLDY